MPRSGLRHSSTVLGRQRTDPYRPNRNHSVMMDKGTADLAVPMRCTKKSTMMMASDGHDAP